MELALFMARLMPFHYLPDLQIKTTSLYKLVVHFRTKTVCFRTTCIHFRVSFNALAY